MTVGRGSSRDDPSPSLLWARQQCVGLQMPHLMAELLSLQLLKREQDYPNLLNVRVSLFITSVSIYLMRYFMSCLYFASPDLISECQKHIDVIPWKDHTGDDTV
jgi:hypothetical protein